MCRARSRTTETGGGVSARTPSGRTVDSCSQAAGRLVCRAAVGPNLPEVRGREQDSGSLGGACVPGRPQRAVGSPGGRRAPDRCHGDPVDTHQLRGLLAKWVFSASLTSSTCTGTVTPWVLGGRQRGPLFGTATEGLSSREPSAGFPPTAREIDFLVTLSGGSRLALGKTRSWRLYFLVRVTWQIPQPHHGLGFLSGGGKYR